MYGKCFYMYKKNLLCLSFNFQVRWRTMDNRHKQLHDRANDLFSRQQYQQAADLFSQALQLLAPPSSTSTPGAGSSSSSGSPHPQPSPSRHSSTSNNHSHQYNHAPHSHNNHRDLHLSCLNKRATCLIKLVSSFCVCWLLFVPLFVFRKYLE